MSETAVRGLVCQFTKHFVLWWIRISFRRCSDNDAEGTSTLRICSTSFLKHGGRNSIITSQALRVSCLAAFNVGHMVRRKQRRHHLDAVVVGQEVVGQAVCGGM